MIVKNPLNATDASLNHPKDEDLKIVGSYFCSLTETLCDCLIGLMDKHTGAEFPVATIAATTNIESRGSSETHKNNKQAAKRPNTAVRFDLI